MSQHIKNLGNYLKKIGLTIFSIILVIAFGLFLASLALKNPESTVWGMPWRNVTKGIDLLLILGTFFIYVLDTFGCWSKTLPNYARPFTLLALATTVAINNVSEQSLFNPVFLILVTIAVVIFAIIGIVHLCRKNNKAVHDQTSDTQEPTSPQEPITSDVSQGETQGEINDK